MLLHTSFMNENYQKKVQAEGDRRMNLIENMMHGKKTKDTKRNENKKSTSFVKRSQSSNKK